MMEIELRGASVRIENQLVLQPLSLAFRPGQVSVVLGPNGAGKTTLLRLLALLARPAGGTVLHDGTNAFQLPGFRRTGLRRRLGFVFQSPLFFSGTVAFNLAYPLRVRGGRLDPEMLRQVLHRVGLEGREGTEARVLSGGEKQRLQLGRLLLTNPEVCLFDEPAASLDPVSNLWFEGEIKRLAGEGRTVVLTTHNLDRAWVIGARILYLQDGQLKHDGTADDFFSRPQSLEAALFSTSGNILEGETSRSRGGISLFSIGAVSIELAGDIPPGRATVLLRPEEILISRAPLLSSARNCLSGKVLDIQAAGPLVWVVCDCGGPSLTVRVTRPSIEALQLARGTPVYLTFKASAIHLLSRS
jgi:tungstate transport system ATP-binding protein